MEIAVRETAFLGYFVITLDCIYSVLTQFDSYY